MDPNNDTWARRFKDWGSLFVSVVVLGLLTMGLILSYRLPDPPAAFTNLMETIKNLAIAVVFFWVGSSASGQKSAEANAVTNAKAMDALADSVPAAAVPALAAPVVPVVSTPSGPAVPVVQEPAPMRQEL